MSVTDPGPFMADMDVAFLEAYKRSPVAKPLKSVTYVEPRMGDVAAISLVKQFDTETNETLMPTVLFSKVITLRDFIDTDAVSLPVCGRCAFPFTPRSPVPKVNNIKLVRPSLFLPNDHPLHPARSSPGVDDRQIRRGDGQPLP